MIFFTAHKEYGHHRHTINFDGTISYSPDPTYALGTDDKVKKIKWIKRGSKNQLIFEEAETYLKAKSDAANKMAQ